MKKEDLTSIEGLTEAQITAIVTASTEELKGFIPKVRFDEVNDTKKDLEKQITDRDTQLSELNKKAKGNEELEKTIKELQAANTTTKTEYESKLKDIKIETAIKDKLTDAKHPDLLAGKFDKSKIVVGADGSISGIDEQLTGIKETYKDLFTPVVAGKNPNNNATPPASKGRRTELETIINNPATKFVDRIAARNQLAALPESEE